MTRITHILGGLVVTAACIEITKNFPPAFVLPSLAAGTVGSVLPDIDLIMGDARKDSIFRHRGFVHTPFFLVILLFLIVYLENRYYVYGSSFLFYSNLFFTLGFLSHLFLDSLNEIGMMWFFPFSKRKYSLQLMRSGSLKEYGFVALPLLLVLFVLFLPLYRSLYVFDSIFHSKYVLYNFLHRGYSR